MTTLNASHAGPADEHSGDHHGHHVSSMGLLLAVFITLLIMTALTVFTAKFVELGYTGNFILAMAIAAFKSSLVCAFFMHMLHDSKFNTVVLLYCLITLSLFIMFTKIDLDSRAVVDPRRHGHINPPTIVEDAKNAAHEAEAGDGHADSTETAHDSPSDHDAAGDH